MSPFSKENKVAYVALGPEKIAARQNKHMPRKAKAEMIGITLSMYLHTDGSPWLMVWKVT